MEPVPDDPPSHGLPVPGRLFADGTACAGTTAPPAPPPAPRLRLVLKDPPPPRRPRGRPRKDGTAPQARTSTPQKPSHRKPAVLQPAAPQPAVPQPATRQPAARQPAARQPAARKAPPKRPEAATPKPAMAHGAEDCATVLEEFIHDSANMPSEMTHLMEEIQAKEKIVQECRGKINALDSNIQKFIKTSGSLAINPKEEQYTREVEVNFDRALRLQDEKIALADKAGSLLDRSVKRLDARIRELENEGLFTNDPPLPSLLDNKNQYRDPPKVFFPDSTPIDSPAYATPRNTTSGNVNPILAAAQRMNQTSARAAGPPPMAAQGSARSSAPATPAATAASHLQQRQRESSAGAVDSKRRRLGASLGTLPAASSNLRQSSLGPGTPKAGTPAGSRAGSVGPRAATGIKKAVTKKIAPHQQVKKTKASASSKHTKRSSSATGRIKLSKKSPAGEGDEDDDSMLSSADMSDSDKSVDADEDMDGEEEEEEGAEDTKVYCTCRTVSHGDMVACDNENCPYEWFHWKCVGLTREPVGTWYCDECRKTLGK